MALTFNLDNLADQSIIKDDNQLLQTLIFDTMFVGMGVITEKNVEEFFHRICFMERIGGAHLNRRNTETNAIEPRPITLADCLRVVGLTTNVGKGDTKSQFIKRLADSHWRDAAHEVQRQKVPPNAKAA